MAYTRKSAVSDNWLSTIEVGRRGYFGEVCFGTNYYSVRYNSKTPINFGITNCIGNSASKVDSNSRFKKCAKWLVFNNKDTEYIVPGTWVCIVI